MSVAKAQQQFLLLLPPSQRLAALDAMHPEIASILEAMKIRPSAIRRCPAAKLPLLFAGCADIDLLRQGVATDKRVVARLLLEELDATPASHSQAGPRQSFTRLMQDVDSHDPAWWSAVHRCVSSLPADEAALAAREVFTVVPGAFYASQIVYEHAARLAAIAIPPGTAKLPDELSQIDVDVAARLLRLIELPPPAVLAPLFERVGAHDGVAVALLSASLEIASDTLAHRMLQAGDRWWLNAAQVPVKGLPNWGLAMCVLLGAKFTQVAHATLCEEAPAGAWALAQLCRHPANRRVLAQAAFEEGVFVADRSKGSLWDQMVRELLLDDVDVSRASNRACQLLDSLQDQVLYGDVGFTLDGTEHLNELVKLASHEHPMRVLDFAQHVDIAALLPHCPGMGPLVFSDPLAAEVFAPFFSSRLANAGEEEWKMAFQLSSEWTGTIDELLQAVVAVRS